MNHPQPNRFDIEIAQQGAKISNALHMLRSQQYPPDAKKGLRKFSWEKSRTSSGSPRAIFGKIHLEGKGPEVESVGGRPLLYG